MSSTRAAVEAAWAAVLGDGTGPGSTFFTAGGHSLAAARLLARLREDLGVDVPLALLLRDDPTLDELATLVADRAGSAPVRPVAVHAAPPGRSDVPLPPTLTRLWVWHRLHPHSPAYNVVRVIEVAGRLEPGPLRAALRDLADRHDGLRASVVGGPGDVRLVTADDVRVPLSVEVLRVAPDGEPVGGRVEAALRRVADLPFPMDRAPLWRAGLVVDPAAGTSWLVIALHHLVSDLRASDVMLRDLAACYEARRAGKVPQFAGPAPSLLALAEHEHVVAATGEDDLRWWQERLAGAVPYRLPPLARGSGAAAEPEPDRIDSVLLGGDAVDRTLRERRWTPAAFFLTAVAAVVRGWQGESGPTLLGVPSVRTTRREFEDVVGFSLDSVPVPYGAASTESFAAAYATVLAGLTDGVAHGRPTFDRIVERLRLPRSGTDSPLIQVWFNDLTSASCPPALGGRPAVELDLPPAWALFDLNVYLRRVEDGYRLHVVSPAGMFHPADARALAEQIARVARAAAAAPSAAMSALLAPPAAAPSAPAPAPAVESTDELVRRHARERPDAPAVLDRSGPLDYRSLDAEVERLAGTLRDGDRVAVPAQRHRAFLVHLLACWRAGAVPVLVDARWPGARYRSAVEAAGVPGRPGAADRQHVLFTSGTTGGPLGVLVRSAVTDSAADDLREMFEVGSGDRVAFLAGPAHDAGLRDVLLALRSGATLCVPPDDVVDRLPAVPAWLREQRITVVDATPALLQLSLGVSRVPLPDLRLVVCGGAPLTADTVRTVRTAAGAATVVNGYGCTETPQLVTALVLPPGSTPAGPPSVGRPLPGRVVELRRPDGARCDTGQLGELWVAEPYIAAGYVGGGRPDRFGTGSDGRRWFGTGDLGRVDAVGEVHLAGRADRQVLVNEHRVLLDEVEDAARRCPGVAEAVAEVIDGAAGNALRLWARPRPGAAPTAEQLRAHLRGVLAGPMVPGRIVVTDRLGLSGTLKPDAAGLADPGTPETASSRRPAGRAAGSVEDQVRAVAEAVAGTHLPSRANFFDAGLSSVALLQLAAELESALGRPVSPVDVFARPTLRSLGAFLAGTDETAPAPSGSSASARRRASGRTARRTARADLGVDGA